MSSNPTAESSPTAQPTSSPPQPGSGRLIVLLVLLSVGIAALAYDYLAAGPGIEADDKKLEAFVDESNRKGVAETKRITPVEIHELLGRQPTWIDKHPDQSYDVEYYCGWGAVPVLNMRRHFLAVVYVGDEPRRYNSHHKNENPPLEALPIQQSAADETGDGLPAPTSSSDGSKSGEAASGEGKTNGAAAEGTPAEGAKKRKSKKKPDDNQEAKDAPPLDEKKAD